MNDLPVLRFHYPNSETVAYDVPIGRIGQHNVSIGISIDTVDPAVLPAPPAESVDHVTLNQPFRELQVVTRLRTGARDSSPWCIGGGFAPRGPAMWLSVDPPALIPNRGIDSEDIDRLAMFAEAHGAASYCCIHQDTSALPSSGSWDLRVDQVQRLVPPCPVSGFRFRSKLLYRPVDDTAECEVRALSHRLITVGMHRSQDWRCRR